MRGGASFFLFRFFVIISHDRRDFPRSDDSRRSSRRQRKRKHLNGGGGEGGRIEETVSVFCVIFDIILCRSFLPPLVVCVFIMLALSFRRLSVVHPSFFFTNVSCCCLFFCVFFLWLPLGTPDDRAAGDVQGDGARGAEAYPEHRVPRSGDGGVPFQPRNEQVFLPRA